jgi:hypothetical protein
MIIRRFPAFSGIFIILISGCMYLTGKVNLDVPDQAPMRKEAGTQLVPGTKVLLVPPPNFPLIASIGRFEKDPDDFIEVSESESSSYYKRKSHIDRIIDLAKTKGLKLYYEKEFNYGPYRAYIVFGPENNPDKDQIVLVLGNDNFVTTIAGQFLKGDVSTRKMVYQAIMTAFIDTSIKPDLSVFARYTLDLSGTSFKFCTHSAKSYYYTVEGTGDPESNLVLSQILVTELPPMNEKAIRQYAINALDNYSQLGYTIHSQQQKDTSINGNFAAEIIFHASFEGKPNSVYQLVTGNAKAAVLFCGIAFESQDSLVYLYSRIGATLTLK